MKKSTSIHKAMKASLVFLISASPVVNATEKNDKPEEGQVASERLRDHDYYKAELQKLEESTRRIHEEVDRILGEFRQNMEEYYLRTGGASGIATTLGILQDIQDHNSIPGNPISLEGTKVENEKETVINRNLIHSSQPNGKEDPDTSQTFNRIDDTEKEEEEGFNPHPSEGGTQTVKMVENALEAEKEDAEGVGDQRALTAEDLQAIQGFEELVWNDPGVVKAANYYCKLFKTTEIGESRTGSIIHNIDLIHILQNSGQDEPTENDIARLFTYLHYLESIGLSKLPAVQSAFAQYILYKKQQDNDDSFGVLIINGFKDARPWWLPGKKVVPETASFSSPKNNNENTIYSNIIKKENTEEYDDMKEYMNGNKIKFSEDLLIKKNITKVIIFDDVKKIDDKIFVKGHHVFTWDATFGRMEAPET